MKVLVTGHKGYIGSILAPMLEVEGHDVIGLDSGLYDLCTFGEPGPPVPEIVKDLRDVVASDLEGIDAIIHLAGLSNDPLGDFDPQLTLEINYTASVRLARLAKEAGINRFIFSSSCSNYGASGEDMINEEGQFLPVTPYAVSKVLVERDVSKLADQDFSPTFLRNATAYGVSARHRFDLVLNNLVAWAVTTGKILLKSDGSPWRPIVHIEDISRAFIAVLNAGREQVHNEAFNIGRSDENYSMRELAEIVREIVPGSHIEYADNAGPDKRSYRVDCSKFSRRFPGHMPKWDARQGVTELFEAYQKHGLRIDDFEGSRYRRIDHIRFLMDSGRLDSLLRWREQAVA